MEPRSELLLTGVFGAAVRVVVRPLLPQVVARNAIAAANDELSVMPRLVGQLLETASDESARILGAAGHAYLAGQGLFSDPVAAGRAASLARQHIDRLLEDLRRRGCTIVEVDTEQVVFGVPPTWNATTELAVAEAAAAYLPDGVRVTYPGHYVALYARAPRSSMMLGADGEVTLIGSMFRPGRLERFGESFMLRAAPFALQGDAVGLRRLFLETVHLLRTSQVALEDLCVQVTLHKSLPQYRRNGTREEPYEVLLDAGVRSWRVGQRIRYFRARGGEPRLLQEGDEIAVAEADTEYYVQRLSAVYCQQFAQAFRRDDFLRIFRLPPGTGPFEEPEMPAELAGITPMTEPVR
jgi:hypothetical protein